jgi:hypothetical protein
LYISYDGGVHGSILEQPQKASTSKLGTSSFNSYLVRPIASLDIAPPPIDNGWARARIKSPKETKSIQTKSQVRVPHMQVSAIFYWAVYTKYAEPRDGGLLYTASSLDQKEGINAKPISSAAQLKIRQPGMSRYVYLLIQ